LGKPITHLELASKDLNESKRFYSKLFGWKFEMYGDAYAIFRAAKKGLPGGGFQLSKKVISGTTTLYVEVESIPKTQQKATSLGGRTMKRKKAIGGGMGYWGTIRDPHGNTIGLWSKR
jgi:predicted enzyme related to lactoylglutathione lyase